MRLRWGQMINDLERARAYRQALEAEMGVLARQAHDEHSVLDLGCGSGLSPRPPHSFSPVGTQAVRKERSRRQRLIVVPERLTVVLLRGSQWCCYRLGRGSSLCCYRLRLHPSLASLACMPACLACTWMRWAYKGVHPPEAVRSKGRLIGVGGRSGGFGRIAGHASCSSRRPVFPRPSFHFLPALDDTRAH